MANRNPHLNELAQRFAAECTEHTLASAAAWLKKQGPEARGVHPSTILLRLGIRTKYLHAGQPRS